VGQRYREIAPQANELAAIVAGSDDAILSKGLDGTILSWNAAAGRLYGFTAAEAIGSHVSILVPEDRHAEVDQILRRIRAGDRVDHHETIRQRKDGSLLQVSVSVSPVHDADGRIVAASVIARDVTKRFEVELALTESERHRRAILASMLRAEEEERSRIATALHDDTVQVMTASLIAMDRVALVARQTGNERLESALSVARATLEEATERTRRLMFELRPALLYDHGLAAALRVLAEQTAREVGATATVVGTVGRYEHPVEELLYRSAQEALANVRRHARPHNIQITLAEEADVVTVAVRDDGRGVDVADIAPARPRHCTSAWTLSWSAPAPPAGMSTSPLPPERTPGSASPSRAQPAQATPSYSTSPRLPRSFVAAAYPPAATMPTPTPRMALPVRRRLARG
jgi:PAS domain S-box-containing protein